MSRHSNRAMVGFINQHTGIPQRDIKACILGMSDFVSRELQAGNTINFFGLGTFRLKLRRGRTVRGKYQPDSHYVRFIPSYLLVDKLHATH